MGTSSLEAKMLQQLTSMKEEVLYKVFLDLKKVYDALGREHFMDILVSYRAGSWT